MRPAALPLLLLLVLPLLHPALARRQKAKHVFETKLAFTAAECETIVGAALAQPQEQSVLHDGKGGSRRDVHSRDSTLSWLDVNKGSEMRWVLERMEAQLHGGEKAWGVRSLGLGTAGIQVARYGPDHHYEWHTDSSAPVGGPSEGRVLSVTVQLTPPADYEGGQVEMGTYGNVSTDVGNMVLFPSYLPHKVHRVTSGVRYSIVAWFVGAWDTAYWRQAQGSYGAMLTEHPEICEAHEWFAETLASEGAMEAAVSSLVDCLECNDGSRVLQQRVIENAAGSARLPGVLMAAEGKFRAAGSAVARENLRKVLQATGRQAEAGSLALAVGVGDSDDSEAEADRAAKVSAAMTAEDDLDAAQDDMLDALLDDLEDVRAATVSAAVAGGKAGDMDAAQGDLLDGLLDEL